MDMEQLDPNLANKTLWLNPEEEDEVGVDLLARRSSSRHPPNGVGATATTAAGEPALQIPEQPVEEKEDAPVTYGGQPNEEVGVGNNVYFDKVQGTESINETNGMQSEIIKIPSTETNRQTMKISEDKKDFGQHQLNMYMKQMEVSRVLRMKPNSCITKRVILIRRRPKVSIRHKPNRGSKLDPVPNSAGFGGSDDTPEIHSDVIAAATPDEQNDSSERDQKQEQEAFSCLSCFSLFIPLGNGCFKIFQFFRWGRQTELPQSTLEIRQRENTQRPPEIRQREDTGSAQGTNLSEHTKSSSDKPGGENTKPSSYNPEWKHRNSSTQSSPVQAYHAISVQSAAVPSPSLFNKGYIDGTAIKPKEPGISNIFSSTNSSIVDKLKADSTEQKPDIDLFQRNVGNNEIKDFETGLLDSTLQSGTDVAPLSQRITETERRGSGAGEIHDWEILKSIVYGGLVESITSLGVVSSAAGAGANTLNILALGVANLIGGVIIIFHNLKELKNDRPPINEASGIEEDQYQALLGRRQNFMMHVTVVILSFLIFGMVPPVVYGFSFRNSDNRDLKLAAVAGASLICIFLLALGKGHVRRPHRTYFRSVLYYIGLGITVSGISYVVGQLLKKLLEQLGLFESSSTVSSLFLETVSTEVGRASY
ncbi:dof zinc finger protein DOF4.6-like [Hibiscus syriacus]|uniref:Dof zinc finger protein DOF4.6-like n=1 Tax=Hibiscus syriacus TaxID=106335 RepID=A0A6A3AV62_HIBSY|nr:dof zinc finger protein DOF4.6-like [Hibiscus syriacus]